MEILERFGRLLARYLAAPGSREVRVATCRPDLLAATLRRGDVLLVEGSSRFSTAVKYLTQSTWSHAALCSVDLAGREPADPAAIELIEADVVDGVRRVSLEPFARLHTRICRPVGLATGEVDRIVAYAEARIGQRYDLKNIVDLARYLVQTPPVPTRWRRRMLALGSGDPTRAICSSLIAQAFQSARYPILPEVVYRHSGDPACNDCYEELLHIRHHSLFAPRDFDISPYFEIVKPTLTQRFDPHSLSWLDEPVEATV